MEWRRKGLDNETSGSKIVADRCLASPVIAEQHALTIIHIISGDPYVIYIVF